VGSNLLPSTDYGWNGRLEIVGTRTQIGMPAPARRGSRRLLLAAALAGLITFHIDGFGGQEDKKRKYDLLAGDRGWHNGFKLFLEADIGMMTPDQVMRLKPRPDLITYQ
jgi:hypothetical protein